MCIHIDDTRASVILGPTLREELGLKKEVSKKLPNDEWLCELERQPGWLGSPYAVAGMYGRRARATRCCANTHTLAPESRHPTACCLFASCSRVRRTAFLDVDVPHSIAVEFLFVDLDLIANPDLRRGLPDNHNVILRRARRGPLFIHARCPAEIGLSRGVT